MQIKNNKYLTFLLGNENYGIPILDVKEIIGMMTITQIPKMPKFIKGVINLRGQIIPVMDLRSKFEMFEKDYNDRTCIIVVESFNQKNSSLNGLIVDIVNEVIDIPKENIEIPPSYGEVSGEEFFTGIGKIKEKVIILLDANKILSDLEQMQEQVKENV